MHRVGIAALGALAIALVPVSAVSAAPAASPKNACTVVTPAEASKALRSTVDDGTHEIENGYSMCTYKVRSFQLKVGTRLRTWDDFYDDVFAFRGLEFGVAEISPNARASYYRKSLTVLLWKTGPGGKAKGKKGTELFVRVTGVPKEYTMGVVETVAKPALRRI